MYHFENPWDNFRALELSYHYTKTLETLTAKLNETKSADLLNYKRAKTRDRSDLNAKGDFPNLISKGDLEKCVLDNTWFLKNSHEFWTKSPKVTDAIRPITFYYSWQQFAAFFIYTFFKWTKPSGGHGVYCNLGSIDKDIGKLKVEFRQTGFFQRLIDTFVVLGHPTAYGKWMPIQAQDGLIYQSNDIGFGEKTDLSHLLDFDARSFEKSFKSVYPNSYYGSHIDAHLTSFLLAFIASDVARYRPRLWRDVVNGNGENEARFHLKIKDAYAEYVEKTVSFMNTVYSELIKYYR